MHTWQYYFYGQPLAPRRDSWVAAVQDAIDGGHCERIGPRVILTTTLAEIVRH